ncbi:MAG TPA: hypothetical protein VJW20_04255 [Candidatus Angelobacter sp.]|nr:hypothetical protein [Candidatus Angelobacter sp.]
MVHGHQQDVFIRIDEQQFHPEQRAIRQIESLAGFRSDPMCDLHRHCFICTQVFDLQSRFPVGHDDLNRLSILDSDFGSEDLVTANNLLERTMQSNNIQISP